MQIQSAFLKCPSFLQCRAVHVAVSLRSVLIFNGTLSFFYDSQELHIIASSSSSRLVRKLSWVVYGHYALCKQFDAHL